MTVGTSNNQSVNMKILTRTLQTEVNKQFGKEKVKKTVILYMKHYLKESSFLFRPIVLYMVGKLVTREIL